MEMLTQEPVEPPPSSKSVGFTRSELPSSFGPYRVEREIAAGGMGVVYLAEDTRLHRPVALKMLRQVLFTTEQERLRFYSEAELASQLDHPNIVPILEVGKFEGQPFFAMKYVRGGNLADRLERGALPKREAADLLVKVARAVHYAHQRGVLHRDLKPANILLDESGEPWLTDFGLAKLLDTDSALTLTQAIAGTPHYMAPEQVAGCKKDISTATDVWALGVILYEMLTGRLPFQADSHSGILREVAEKEPPEPSTIMPTIDRDLQTLCLRCLDKDPSRRLSSAGELAEELERWQRGEPIRARRITAVERIAKWMRRHPYRAAVLGVFIAVTVGSGAAITWQWRRAEANARMERRTAYSGTLAQAMAAREHHDFGQARSLLDGIDPELRGFDWRLLKAICRGDDELAFRLADGSSAAPQCLTFLPDGEQLAILSADGRLHLRDKQGAEVAPPRTLPPIAGEQNENHGYYGLQYSPDGKRLAYGCGDVLHVLDAATLEILYEETSRSPQFGWLDDDRLLYGFNGSVSAPPWPKAGAWILDFRDVHSPGDKIPRTSFPEMCAPLAVSPDRRFFALHRVKTVPGWTRSLHVYEADGDLAEIPAPLYSMPGREYPGDLALSRSGKFLAFSAGVEVNRSVRVLEVSTGEVLFDHEFQFPIRGLAIDSPEQRLALAGGDSAVRVYDFTRGAPEDAMTNTYDDEVVPARRQQVDPRGAHAPPHSLITRSAQDGRARFYLGHEKRVLDATFDPTGSLVTASDDGTIRRWPVGVPRPTVRLGFLQSTSRTFHPAASRDGLQMLYITNQSSWLCDVARSRVEKEDVALLVADLHAPLAVLLDGRPITQDRGLADIVIWERRDGRLSEEKRLPGECLNARRDGRTRSGVLSRDEKRLVGSSDGWLFSVDLEEGSVTWSGALGNSGSAFAGHDLSPDGEWIASSDFGPRVSIHRFAEPDTIVTFLGGETRASDTAVCFSPDGRRLYTGNEDGRIRVWETTNWQELPELGWDAHRGAVTALAVSHDRTLIATSGDNTLRLFPIDPEPGESQRRERLSLYLDQPANWIQFALGADGRDRALLHSTPGGTLDVWETDLDQR